MSLSIFAAFGAMACWGFGDFIIQKSVRKIGNMEALAWIGVVGSVGLLPFIWNDFFLVMRASNFLVLFVLGIVTFGTTVISFEALKRGKISVVEVIFEIELPIAVLLGLFFLKESLSGTQILLIFLIFMGIILIAVEPDEIKRNIFLGRGIILAFITAVGMGAIDLLTAVGAKTISPLLTIWFTWVTCTIICFIYMACRGRLVQFFKDAMKYKKLVFGMGAIDTLAWVLFAVAARHNELAITVAITEGFPAIGLILGVTINREKVAIHQYIGAAIAIVASFAMGLSAH